MEDDRTFTEYRTSSSGETVAVFSLKYPLVTMDGQGNPIRQSEVTYNRQALEQRAATMLGSGNTCPETQKALTGWPPG